MALKKKVGIVGGGLAGLSCGYELMKQGIEVTVLEKTNWVGGRTRSEIFEGHRINLGAVWITPIYDEHYVGYLKEFGIEKEELDVPVIGLNQLGLQYGDKLTKLTKFSVAFSGIFSISELIRLLGVEKFIKKQRFDQESYTPELERLHKISAADFFRQRGFSERFVEKIVQPFTTMCGVSDPYSISAPYGLRLIGTGFQINKAPKSTMDIVARGLHQRLGDRVMLGSSVNRIIQREGEFTIELTKNGEPDELEADILVLAVPIPVSNQLMPGLNEDFSYGGYPTVVVKGRLKPGYRKFLGVMFPKAKNSHNVFFLYTGREDPKVSYVHLYKRPYDLSPFYESYEILQEFDWNPSSGAPRPGQVFPNLKTHIKDVYICGDFLRYPCTDSALAAGKRVAHLISAQ
ncbi:MAG TPA: FAD-dependent oxidoreductase [Syntrophales bacterium]|nr:FAD-dependent oxidoreductase [Syntrophales bacterium]